MSGSDWISTLQKDLPMGIGAVAALSTRILEDDSVFAG